MATITMTPNQILRAYNAARELSKIVLPYKAARPVVQLKRQLEDEFHTIAGMEDALLQEFSGKKEQNGQFRFPDNETAEAFLEKYNSAMEEPADIQFNRVDLSRYTDAIKISPASVDALDGIVVFEAQTDGR